MYILKTEVLTSAYPIKHDYNMTYNIYFVPLIFRLIFKWNSRNFPHPLDLHASFH